MMQETKLEKTVRTIVPGDKRVYAEARQVWDSIAKPLDGLGMLEEMVCRVLAAQGSLEGSIAQRALAVFCADNGVVVEGVTQSGSEVTSLVAENLCTHSTSVCCMADVARCKVVPVDVGMLTDLDDPRLYNKKRVHGTRNIAEGPAMTQEELMAAVEAGIDMAHEFFQEGYTLMAAGEMGIGNTTTSSAVACVLLHKQADEMTGKGAGLSAEGLAHKIAIVQQAIRVNKPEAHDPLEVVRKVGGFDIAAMCGFYIGAASLRCPIILDGFISGVAALCAVRLCPNVADYLLASHQSAESAAKKVLQELGFVAPVQAGLHLGEGTGAMTLIPLLDMAFAVFRQGRTFVESTIDPYVVQD